MTLLLSAIAPAIIIMWLIYRHDHEENKEPIGLLLKCFFGGVFSILLTCGFHFFLIPDFNFVMPFTSSFYESFFQAAIPEEISKWLMLYIIVRKSEAFDNYYDGIVYAVFVSMGFALVENILYVIEGGIGTAIVRAIFAVPGHMLDGVVMGYFFALAHFSIPSKKSRYLFLSILAPIITHGIYDFLCFYMESIYYTSIKAICFFAFIAFNIWLWKYCLKKIKLLKQLN